MTTDIAKRMKITLLLPLPPKELSPNARLHYMEKAKHTERYRTMIQLLSFLEAGGARAGEGRHRLAETYMIAGKRKHDVRNLFAAFKAGEDGLVDAGLLPGDDDSVLEHGAPRIERVKTKAEEGVLVEITEILS